MATKKPAPPAPVKLVKAGCPTCKSSGYQDEDPTKPFCPDCLGAGTQNVPAEQTEDCADCNGKGSDHHGPCRPCCHTGKIIPVEPPPPEEPPIDVAALKKQISDLQEENAALKKKKKAD